MKRSSFKSTLFLAALTIFFLPVISSNVLAVNDVNFTDYSPLANDWWRCVEPDDYSCEKPWMGDVELAYEVINIDINGGLNDPCYCGRGPVGNPDWTTVCWNGFCQGEGVMMVSPRCENIGNPGNPATYGRAIVIADPCTHNYQPYVTGNDLLEDGFVKSGLPTDPNPGLFIFGTMAYGGVYDVYVVSRLAGSFTITDSNGDTQSASLSGGAGAWAEGTNYVKFEDVEIDTPDSQDANGQDANYVANQEYLTDPNCVFLSYSNQINGIQFASVKRRLMNARGVPPNDPNFDSVGNTAAYWSTATPIYIGTTGKYQNVFAADYDAAYETNQRNGESDYDGPDADWVTGSMHYIDTNESWTYDVLIDDISDGAYRVRFLVNLKWGNAGFSVYIDDSLELGRMTIDIVEGVDANIPYWSTDYTNVTSTPVTGWLDLNLFQGLKKFKIKSNRIYFDFHGFQLHHLPWVFEPLYSDSVFNYVTCEEVISYGFGLAGDLNSDCYVNFEDLALFAVAWLQPEP